MTEPEREHWLALKGSRCTVAYDPPSDRATIVGLRIARSFPCNDKVVVRFKDGVRLSVLPRQILSVGE